MGQSAGDHTVTIPNHDVIVAFTGELHISDGQSRSSAIRYGSSTEIPLVSRRNRKRRISGLSFHSYREAGGGSQKHIGGVVRLGSDAQQRASINGEVGSQNGPTPIEDHDVVNTSLAELEVG